MPREGIYYFPLKEKFQEINRTCFYIEKRKSKHPRRENMKWDEKEEDEDEERVRGR